VLKYDKENKLSSPYKDWFKWEIGVEYKADNAKLIYDGEIHEGYFHTYDTFHAAEKSVFSMKGYFKKIVICKCIIPKHTYFYHGIHSDGQEGYASKSLKIVEILSTTNE
jgi:hypothetical protein